MPFPTLQLHPRRFLWARFLHHSLRSFVVFLLSWKTSRHRNITICLCKTAAFLHKIWQKGHWTEQNSQNYYFLKKSWKIWPPFHFHRKPRNLTSAEEGGGRSQHVETWEIDKNENLILKKYIHIPTRNWSISSLIWVRDVDSQAWSALLLSLSLSGRPPDQQTCL